MTHFKSLLAQSLLAVGLLTGAALANAGAIYHVDIDTTQFATGGATTGYLDLYFIPFVAADALTATVSNLHGGFLGAPMSTNVTAGADGSLVFLNDIATDYAQQFTLGQTISFDISFDGMVSDAGSAGFGADIINGDFSDYLSRAVSFTLLPDAAPTIVTDAGIGSVQLAAAVPEPSMLLSLFTGLGLMGLTLRRRQG